MKRRLRIGLGALLFASSGFAQRVAPLDQELQSAPVTSLSGVVQHPDGSSAVGVRVVAIPHGLAPMLVGLPAAEALEHPLVHTTTTLEGGWFVMSGLGVGKSVDVRYELLAASARDATLARVIVPFPKTTPIELELAPVHAAKLHFVEPDGREARTFNRLTDDSGARFVYQGSGLEFIPGDSLAYRLLEITDDESHWTALLIDEREPESDEPLEFAVSFAGYHHLRTTLAVAPLSDEDGGREIVLRPYPGERGALTLRLPDFPDLPVPGLVGPPLIAKLKNIDGHTWRIPVREVRGGELTLADLPHGRYELVLEWRPRIERVPAFGQAPFIVEICEAAPTVYELRANLTCVPLQILEPDGRPYRGPLSVEFADSKWRERFYRPSDEGQLTVHFRGPPYELVLPLPAVQAIVGRERLSATIVRPSPSATIRLEATSPGRASGDWFAPRYTSDREVTLSTMLTWR